MTLSISGVSAIPRPHLYLPDGWDMGWKAARALIPSQPIWITLLGDSIGQGKKASDFLSTGWFGKLRTSLLNNYTLYGDYYPTCDSNEAMAAIIGDSWSGGTPPWVQNNVNGRTYGKNGWQYMPYYSVLGSAVYQTFTTPYACTDIDILYADYAAGTFQYRIDTGTWVTVTTAGTGVAADFSIKRIQLTGLSAATHTIDFGNQSAAFVLQILGCATYRSRTAGLGFARQSITDWQLADGASSANTPVDRIRLWQGMSPQRDGAITTSTGFGFPIAPHLAIIALGINDCGGGVTIANYQDALRRYIQAFRRGQTNNSIIIIGYSNPDGINSDQTTTFTNAANWHTFLMAQRNMAEAYNCAFVNIHDRWGETPVTGGYQTQGEPHPNDTGHADIASTILTLL